jgi:hypothetical protein
MNLVKAALLVGFFAVLTTAPAQADDDGASVTTAPTGVLLHVIDAQGGSGSVTPVVSGDPIVSSFEEAVCALGGADTCAEVAACDDGEPMTYTTYVTASGVLLPGGDNCPEDAVVQQPQVTPGLVLSAFRRVPLPASELVVQPPGGRTLVNFETNFYTEQGEFTRVVRLLGQRVELRIWPASFVWHYGDGSTEQTSSAGSPYPHLEITHRYLSKGRVAARVDTTYAADFRVSGGSWREVGGTVTIPGAAEALRVVTARPVLVGG